MPSPDEHHRPMIRATARSAATPDRLWSLASDVERWGDRLPTVDSVRPAGQRPAGVGSRFDVRQPRMPKAVWEVTDWQQGAVLHLGVREPGDTQHGRAHRAR